MFALILARFLAEYQKASYEVIAADSTFSADYSFDQRAQAHAKHKGVQIKVRDGNNNLHKVGNP